ncbi:transmembrane protein 220-like [Glandiceps talaboti]
MKGRMDGKDGRMPLSSTETLKPISPARSFILRSIHVVMTIFFFLCAITQVNDSDPFIWMPLYLVAFVLTALVARSLDICENPIWRCLALTHIIVCTFGIIYLLLIVVKSMEGHFMRNPMIFEEGREMVGLFIMTLWLSISRFSRCHHVVQRGIAVTTILTFLAIIVGLLPIALWSLCLVPSLSSFSHCGDMP